MWARYLDRQPTATTPGQLLITSFFHATHAQPSFQERCLQSAEKRAVANFWSSLQQVVTLNHSPPEWGDLVSSPSHPFLYLSGTGSDKKILLNLPMAARLPHDISD